MSKAVLLSIQPKWCELIASGKKTVEVRKRRPNLAPPFKVYIYQTRRTWIYDIYSRISDWQGKVIGEFVCDRIDEHTNYSLDEQHGHIKRREDLLRSACMTLKDWRDYIGSYRSDWGCAWHISSLIIYDKPKELSEFETKRTITTLTTEHNIEGIVHYPKKEIVFDKLIRPPQSWCYVEEING